MIRVTVAEIIKTVAAYYDIGASDLTGKCKRRVFARPRQIAYYLARTLTPRSYPEIGKLFGGRDHSTLIHGCELIEQLILTDGKIRRDVEKLRARLGHPIGLPSNDNEPTAEMSEAEAKRIAEQAEFIRIHEKRRRDMRMAKIRAYLEVRRVREFDRRMVSMDEIEFMDWRVAQYAKQPLELRMAD